jgi:hypothetical protein
MLSGMEDPALRPWRRLTQNLCNPPLEGIIHGKDVKNEDRSGDMYENKGSSDIMPESKSDIVFQFAEVLRNSADFCGQCGRLYVSPAILGVTDSGRFARIDGSRPSPHSDPRKDRPPTSGRGSRAHPEPLFRGGAPPIAFMV